MGQFLDSTGKCNIWMPPHRYRVDSCLEHCNNKPPGKYKSWLHYDNVLGAEIKTRKLAEKLIGTPYQGMVYGDNYYL